MERIRFDLMNLPGKFFLWVRPELLTRWKHHTEQDKLTAEIKIIRALIWRNFSFVLQKKFVFSHFLFIHEKNNCVRFASFISDIFFLIIDWNSLNWETLVVDNCVIPEFPCVRQLKLTRANVYLISFSLLISNQSDWRSIFKCKK